MANEIKELFGTPVTPAITMNGITNAAGRVCAQINNTTVRANKYYVYWEVQTGTTPTVGTIFKMYLIRRDALTQNYDSDGITSETDAAISVEPPNADLVGAMKVTASSDVDTFKDFILEDPGPAFALVFWNATGATTHATGTNNELRLTPATPEVQ